METKLKIAIIDSGVYHAHKDFFETKIYEITPSGSPVKSNVRNGHGTAVYNIIRKECAKGCELINIRAVESQEVDVDVLIRALNLAIELEVKIINLSLGVTVCLDMENFREVCHRAYDNGIILISAFSNDGSMSFPAAFPEVIGVTSEESITKSNNFYYVEDNVINVVARGGIQRLAWNEPEYMFLGGNSFACAHVTAIISKLISRNTTVEEAHRMLQENAVKTIQLNYSDQKQNFIPIKRAAVFPFSKEIQGILAHQNLIDFEIDAVYDIKYSGRVGANVSQLMPYARIMMDYKIKNIRDIDFNNIDTMIIGHRDKLKNKVKKEDVFHDLAENCVKNQVQIFSLDDLDEYKISKGYVYTPAVLKKEVLPKRQGKLFRYNKPILGVFGTSSKQGKFTLQLLLREKIMKRGYSIGQLGTEPTAELFGFDYVFPIGYNSLVELQNEEAVQYINMQMQSICEKEPDIIIVGCQSGTVSYDYGNISFYLFQQYAFLVATQPDAVILCINYFDELEYIRRTVQFIESSSPSKVIAFVVFPVKLEKEIAGVYGKKTVISEDEFKQRKSIVEKVFGIRTFLLNQDIEEVVNHVIDFFCEEE